MNLGVVVSLIQSLKLFTESLRDKFAEYESKAQAIAKNSQYGDSSRRASKCSHRITFLEGPAPDTVLAPSDKFRVDTYLAVVDSLIGGLSHRLAAYEEIHSLFGFFAELRDTDIKTVEDGCSKLAAFYHADLAEEDLISECKHFKHHICCWHRYKVPHAHPTISEMYSLIKTDSLESTFPNMKLHYEYT